MQESSGNLTQGRGPASAGSAGYTDPEAATRSTPEERVEMGNWVEMLGGFDDDDDDCAFDQPCAYGHRVEGHAVYCHNQAWRDAPRKCRRTWYTGGEVRDEDCPGYKPNPRLGAV